MYSRTLAAIALAVVSFNTLLVSASPAPIDPNMAAVVAAKNNMGCSAPGACTNANATVEAVSTSGAVSSIGGCSAPAVVIAIAGTVVAALFP